MRHDRPGNHPASKQPRPQRRIHEETPAKLPDLTRCPRCEACYRDGRWTWTKAPAGSHEHICPACERIENDYPGGLVHVGGGFAASHRDELIGLLRHVEENETLEHPLNRIMSIGDEDGGFVVKTTDGELAQALGRALRRAYDGDLQHPGSTSEKERLVRVRWSRD